MVQVSTRGDYGLLFLAYLVNQDKAVSVKEISKRLHLPYKYLGQIASQLSQAGLVKSKEGRGGGYYLARQPEKISLSEVLTSLEGRINVRCHLGKQCPVTDGCLVKNFWQLLSQRLDQVIDRLTLADLKV